MSSDVDLFCTHIIRGEWAYREQTSRSPSDLRARQCQVGCSATIHLVRGVSGHAIAIAVCCNTRCGCKPIYPASYPCTTNSKAVEISRKLRGTRSLDGYRDADILHSSSRRAGPCESASLHSCTGGSAPRPALSAVDMHVLCYKMATILAPW